MRHPFILVNQTGKGGKSEVNAGLKMQIKKAPSRGKALSDSFV
jgi:hypothetical protein